MVLGTRANNRRSPTLHRDFLILIHEIKPWPPSQSLRTVRTVLIQWEHGERYSGSTNTVIPFLGSGIGDGKIEFNESFRISVTLVRDMSVKGGDSSTFQKSCLELNLYEPRRDKTVKGQLLGTAIVDFADYGVVKEAQSISVPINSKRIYNNTSKPLLYLKIQSIEKGRTSSSSKESLSGVLSMERNGGESVSALMNEEYAEEAEIASITDDYVSSPSSMALSSPAFENGGLSHCLQEVMSDSPSEEVYNQPDLIPIQQLVGSETKQGNEVHETESLKAGNGAICASEMSTSALNGSEGSISDGPLARVAPLDHDLDEKLRLENSVLSQVDTETVQSLLAEAMCQTTTVDIIHNGPVNNIDETKYLEKGHEGEVRSEGDHPTKDEQFNEFSDDNMEQGSCASAAVALCEEKLEVNSNTHKLNHGKSVRSSVDSGRSNGSIKSGKLGDDHDGPRCFTSHGRKATKIYTKEVKNTYSDGRIIQLERRIKMLEGELREAAAIEVGLYSVVAEHGSSASKVHAPARRLSRLYLHACKESSKSRRASAARSAASGLVVVAKACGNDVPRLTYWLSNTVVLRAIIEKQLPLYVGPLVERSSGRNGNHRKISPLKWKESSKIMESKDAFSFDDWEDPRTFTSALERIEAWIFSRVIESIWWQTLTPHMQSAAAQAINTDSSFVNSKTYRRTSSSGDQDQVNVSLELWKKAFRDACERLCPVRAGGHECGCLPVLARLIMEQCVGRLDVAMFNAILRESDDEIPTDPLSDPISDAKVLPIPAGKASFGAGAQLKNAIGNWSRWLADLFGIDDDSRGEKNVVHDEDDDNDSEDYDTSSKCFHLLNALSDLMMLPKDMLLSRSIRKEVCPTFGAPLIKRVLSYFVPDEFCPDPIPEVVLESLNSEDPLEEGENSVRNFPCSAPSPVYMPPPATSLCSIIGEIGNESHLRSGSSVLRKSYTSDNELDELDSPLTAIIDGFQPSTGPNWKSKENGISHIAVRYQLLREVWLSSD